jgi:hypothetical protein
MNSILPNGKVRVENSSMRRLEFIAQKPRLKMQFQNSVSGWVIFLTLSRRGKRTCQRTACQVCLASRLPCAAIVENSV